VPTGRFTTPRALAETASKPLPAARDKTRIQCLPLAGFRPLAGFIPGSNPCAEPSKVGTEDVSLTTSDSAAEFVPADRSLAALREAAETTVIHADNTWGASHAAIQLTTFVCVESNVRRKLAVVRCGELQSERGRNRIQPGPLRVNERLCSCYRSQLPSVFRQALSWSGLVKCLVQPK
jgi:hypothetical protein